MKQKKVVEIVIPFQEGIPSHPRISLDARIIEAIELMVDKNLERIAVERKGRVVGMIRLEDAFHQLGIQVPKVKEEKYREKS